MFQKRKKVESAAVTDRIDTQDRGDALFETLNKAKKAKKKKKLFMFLILAAIVAVGLVVSIQVLQRQVRQQFTGSTAEVLNEKAKRGTISTVVSGSGVLMNVDAEVLTVPAGVEITEVLVTFGDRVTEGNLLAIADMTTVRTAMSSLQSEIEKLDKQITSAEGDSVSSYISAGVPGRVKIIYGETGSLVEDTMVEHGGLAVISLDGYMAVDLETGTLSAGDSVTVVLSDGTEKDAVVESVVGGKATILVTDNGPKNDEKVTVKDATGASLGSANLYIHNPLVVTGYAGTINTVNASLNQQVYANTTLFTLSDTSTSAGYDALLRSRSEKEETLLELLQIQRNGGVTAPISGSVYAVADLDAADETGQELELITLSPDKQMSVTISVDEGDILSLELGQTADVTVSSVSEEILPGIVTEIDKTDSSGAYTAVITLDKVTGMIPGMTASIDVRIEGVDDAIIIPADALHQTSTGYYVYTSYDEELKEYGGKVDVIPGIKNSKYVEIQSGLNEGDTVYYTEAQTSFGNRGNGYMGSGGQMPNAGGSFGGGSNYGGGTAGGSGRPAGNKQMPSGN